MKTPIYLDYNATTPIAPEVADAMRPFMNQYFGNPGSAHLFGAQTRLAVERAREQTALLLSCDTSEIVFTSGGTESNNYAIKGAALALKSKGNHIITTQVEHPAVSEVCAFLGRNGFQITYLPVDEWGRVDVNDFIGALSPQTILASVMHANNEVGTIQPIAEISSVCRQNGVVLHCDAAQSVGKIPVGVDVLGVDLLSVAGHKMYAPKGIGVLYVRKGIKLEKLMHGANHEHDRRAGTENVLEIAGLGAASERVMQKLDSDMDHSRTMRDLLWEKLSSNLENIRRNGHWDFVLPNTLSIGFDGIEAQALVSILAEKIAISAGAACHSGTDTISASLTAMKVPLNFARGTIRFSVGRYTTKEEIEYAADEIAKQVRLLRGSEAISQNAGEVIKLTQFTSGMGCACKMRPQALEGILKNLPPVCDSNVLVGTDTRDDAAVYKLTDDIAIVKTVDFFTPIVDDPYQFGSIAAANALSDIYAMGAKALFALNIVAFPTQRLPMHVLESILRGAFDKATEAGISILGGHSIDDVEPKFGMVVTGTVHPLKIIRNSGMKPGNALILTKALGTGILSTANKRGLAAAADMKKAIESMQALNKSAAETMLDFNVDACTDITGFGLLGHLHEMAAGSGMDVVLHFSEIPLLPGTARYAAMDLIPGGTRSNLEFVRDKIKNIAGLSETELFILADAQTSGGLLIALPEKEAPELLKKLKESGMEQASIIGNCSGAGIGTICLF